MQRYNFNLLAHYTVSRRLRAVRRSQVEPGRYAGFQRRPVVHPGPADPVRLPRARPAGQPVPDNGAADDDRQRDHRFGLPSQPDRDVQLDTRQRVSRRTCSLRATSPTSTTAASASCLPASCSTSESATRTSSAIRSASSAVPAARSTTTGSTKSPLNYGKFKEDTTTAGYVDRQRFMLSLDAGRNPVTGQIQCRSQFDPASATAFPSHSRRMRLAWPPTSRLACPTIRSAEPTTALRSTISATAHVTRRRFASSTSWASCRANSSQFFELPGGPSASLSVAEYRREKADYINDPFVESGATNAVVDRRFDPPAFEVKEAFGEVAVADPQGHAVLRGTDGQRCCPRLGLQQRRRNGLDLQRRPRLVAGPRHPVPRQLQPRAPRSEPFGDGLPGRCELRSGLRRSVQLGRTSATIRTARQTARRISVRCSPVSRR